MSTRHRFPAPPPMRKLPVVVQQTTMSSASIYRLVKAGKFPAPVKVGARAVAWIGSEVDAYIASCITTRDSKKV